MIRYATDGPTAPYSDASPEEIADMERMYQPNPEADAQRTRDAIQRVKEAMAPKKYGHMTIRRKHAAALGGKKDLLK